MLPEILWCPPPSHKTDAALRLAAMIVDANVAPGASAAAAVRIDGVFHAFPLWCGSKRWGGLEPICGNEVYDLASVTKPLFALVLARLVQKGRMRFEEPLEKYLSIARGTPAGRSSLDALLAHRARLEAHVEFFAPLRAGQQFEREAALRRAALAVRCDAHAEALPLYSDLGYLLLGEAVREVCGGTLGDIVVGELCQLGLDDLRPARLLPPPMRQRLVPTETVEWRGGEILGSVHDDNAFAFAGEDMCGHAGLFGTARGVLRFGCLLLEAKAGRHARMGPADLEELLKPRPGGSLRAGFDGKSPTGSAAGQLLGPQSFGHLGFTGTSIWCDPKQEIVVVLLANRVCPTRDNLAIRAARPRLHDLLTGLALEHQRSVQLPSSNATV